MIKDFIGTFDNAVSNEYCDYVINHFETLKSFNKTYTRQQFEGVNQTSKKNEIYYLLEESDTQILDTNSKICHTFNDAIWKCYSDYANEYGILSDLSKHHMDNIVQIQKTKPSEGYHMWHCENTKRSHGDRILAILLYLNDIDDGGETEFLYQSIRVKPKKGSLIMFPAYFTHTHRGNPPLKQEKYNMATWINFVE